MTKKFQQLHLTLSLHISVLFRKISNFTPVATAQGSALEKLFQLGVPRLVFQNKILLTEFW